MYAAALPLGITLFLIFVPPAGLSHYGLFGWLLFFAVAVRISMTLFQVPWNAMFAEFSDDYAERTQIVTFRYLCGWIGGTTFVFCTWTFIFPSSEAFTPGHLNPDGYVTFGLVLGIAVTLAILLTTHLTRNQIPFLLQPQLTERFTLGKVLGDIRVAITNKDFLILFFGLFMMTIFGSVTAFIIIPFLQARYDKKHLLITCMVFLLINGIGLICLRFADVLPRNGEFSLLVIIIGNEIVRAGAGTIVAIMFVSMVADTLDKQELETGRRQEGVFSSAMTFAGKATSGVGILIGGMILDYGLAFPRGIKPEEADPELIFSLGLFAGVIIPLFYLVPFWFVSRYGITREIHAGIQQRLVVRRREQASSD